MTLTSDNYFSGEAMKQYWSVSLFKAFDKCEASGLAQIEGRYERELTDSLLIGSYVDAYFSGELDNFIKANGDLMFKKNGELLAKFNHANDIIDRVESDPLMMAYLEGEKQVIKTANLFGVPWKIKMDVYNEVGPDKRIVDLKCVKDFNDIYEDGFGRRSWIEYWGYDIQGAIYQKVEQIASGRNKPLPFYIVAVTKEKVPDIKIIHLPQWYLDTALKVVESKIDRFDLVKTGEFEPIRCERCEYCKRTKVLTEPEEIGTETFMADGILYHKPHK